MRLIALSTIAIMSLGACAEPIEERPEPVETQGPVEPETGTAEDVTPPADAAATAIPDALLGRWGINPGDCTDERGDAKGSIQISGNELRFYESLAKLNEVSVSSPDSIRATFNFTGEGQEWTRELELKLTDDGNKLVRTEFGEDAMAEPLTYAKCPA